MENKNGEWCFLNNIKDNLFLCENLFSVLWLLSNNC